MCFPHNIKKQARKGLQRKINNSLKDKRKSITDNFVLFFVATSKGYLLVDNWISFFPGKINTRNIDIPKK